MNVLQKLQIHIPTFISTVFLPAGITTTPPPRNTTTTGETKPFHNVRLPKNLVPQHYNVFLDVDMVTKNVTGKVTISLVVTQPTKFAVIHAFGFDSIKGKLMTRSGSVLSERYEGMAQFW